MKIQGMGLYSRLNFSLVLKSSAVYINENVMLILCQ
jgi:hypothetical protein